MTTNATAGGARITAGRAPRTVSHLELIVNQTEPTAESVEERVARHLAAKDWLTTPEHWDQGSAWFRADYLAHAREVIALVREADPAAASAVVAPPTDRADLRERIAQALLDHLSRTADIRPSKTGDLAFMPEITDPERLRIADAVLAVLPEQTDRAAEWHAAADALKAYIDRYRSPSIANWTGAVAFLRDRAVEAHDTGTQQPEAPVCGHVNPEGGERCGLEQGHDWHRCVVPLEVGETSLSWAPTEPAPVAQQPAAEAHSCSNCDGVDPATCLANPERQQPELPNDVLIEEYLQFLRGRGPEPDVSDLPPDRREAIAGQFEIVKALADRDAELPPLAQDPVARRLGLQSSGQQAAAADGEETRFLTRVLELFSLSHADAYGDLFWRVENGTVHLSVNVSDVSAWGGADTEPITPEALPALEQAYIDLKALNAEHFTAELYAARQRRERPQGAAYPDERDQGWREVSALLDACGPERQLGLGNPKAAPAHRDPRP